MRTRGLWTAVLCLLVWAACKGGGDGGPPKREPGDLGKEIATTYLAMMAEIGGQVAAVKDTATLRPEMDKLKEKYIASFVALGRERERLAQDGRDECDSATRTHMRQVPDETLDAIDVAKAAAKEGDPELYRCLGDLQQLTQYATFDRLRTQLPEEAARLGIR
ncbi:MAG: hypothetical protein HY905_03710 [Deltaproteobacteria bacterium]|nr:hypothetical protein [Deltaproteobacteria bacterium]